MIKSYITASKDIRFDGNGYGEAWKEEAKRRGLNCESSTPVIIDAYTSPESIRMFGDMHVFTEKELHARNEVKWEIYSKKIQIESRVLNDLALNHIIPVSSNYQAILLDKVMKMREVFPADEAEDLSEHDKEIIRDIARNNKLIKQEVDEMRQARKAANRITNDREKAIAYHNTVLPYLQSIRQYIDNLESIVDDELWTLPKYRELLFIR